MWRVISVGTIISLISEKYPPFSVFVFNAPKTRFISTRVRKSWKRFLLQEYPMLSQRGRRWIREFCGGWRRYVKVPLLRNPNEGSFIPSTPRKVNLHILKDTTRYFIRRRNSFKAYARSPTVTLEYAQASYSNLYRYEFTRPRAYSDRTGDIGTFWRRLGCSIRQTLSNWFRRDTIWVTGDLA